MTHASDLAKLAETFIDRYLVECDARREAEAALAKSEEERATQSANLAAAMAECETLKRDLTNVRGEIRGNVIAADNAEEDLAKAEAARAEWERRYVEADRARGEAENKLTGALHAVDDMNATLAKATREREDMRHDRDMLDAARKQIAKWEREAPKTIADLRAALDEAIAERDALRRAEAGKGAGVVATPRDDERKAWQDATGYSDPAECNEAKERHHAQRAELRTILCDEGEGVITAARRIIKERDEWRAKAEAAEKKREELGARLAELHEAHVRRVDDEARAKAAGEGRPIHRAPATPGPLPLSGDDAWRVFNAEGTHLNGAIAVAGWAFDLGVAHGRTLAQPADAEAKRKAALEAVGDFVYGHARRISEQHNGCTDDETVRDFAVEVHDILNNLRADENAEVYDGRPGRASSSGPTSPAKPAGRYVAVRADEVRGRPCFYTKTEGAARDGARSCNRDLSSFDPDDSVSDMPDIYPWAVVDTATAPQPSPRAVGVDAERLAVAFDNALRMIAGSASAMATAMNRPNMTEAMRRALATIGAQPVVALTIDALHTARVAAVRDAGGIEAHMSTERMFRHLTASGPVAIPAGIDREALIAARTCVMAHGGPGMSRMVQAIDGVIRAGDAGKADAVTVEEIVNAFDDEVDNQPRTTISEDLRTVLTANVGKVIAGAGKP